MQHIVVLGGGPGGYAAAFEAASCGAKVTLVERERLGGTCLNWGCIPTKTILKTAHIIADTKRAEEFGLVGGDIPQVNVDALRTRKESVVDNLVSQIESSARRLKVDVVYGMGRLSDARTVEVETGEGVSRIEADAIIIATGSIPFRLPSIDHTLDCVWTSDDAVGLSTIPREIIIMGGGVIGVEFACAYATFGSKVSIVELAPTVLPGNDKRVTRELAKSLTEQGITLYLATSVDKVEQVEGKAVATLSNGEVLTADVIMSAVGRVPNTAGFGFEEAGIEYDRRAVAVDEHFATNVEGVYAIGDAIGGMMLAHVAEAEGEAAARNAVAWLSGQDPAATVDNSLVAACVYTFPEVAVVGRSTDGAKESGLDVVNAIAKYSANGKALAEGEGEGFVQIVAEKGTGRIVGCQIVGAHAVELITEVSGAMAAGVTVGKLGHNVFAHPTVSEVIKLAAVMAAAKI